MLMTCLNDLTPKQFSQQVRHSNGFGFLCFETDAFGGLLVGADSAINDGVFHGGLCPCYSVSYYNTAPKIRSNRSVRHSLNPPPCDVS